MSTKTIRRMATTRLVSERMRTPLSRPVTTEIVARVVMTAISGNCTMGPTGMPSR
ncbi:hypothetical protein D3C87_1855980 [compost metagenome]